MTITVPPWLITNNVASEGDQATPQALINLETQNCPRKATCNHRRTASFEQSDRTDGIDLSCSVSDPIRISVPHRPNCDVELISQPPRQLASVL